MFDNKTEQEARQEILDLVKEYCDTYHNKAISKKETEFRMLHVYTITMRW